MFKKRRIIVPLIISMSLVFAGCSQDTTNQEGTGEEGNTKEIITLKFANWATAEEATTDKINKVIDAFESEHPNIKIENITIPFSEIQNQLTVSTTAGNAPDIAQVDANTGVSLAAMGVLEPVDDLLSDEFTADVSQSYYETGLYDDKHYLVPWGGGINGFWYNKKIMEQAGLDPNSPPKTMDELEVAMEKIKTLPDVVPLQFDTSPRAFSTTFQWSFMTTIGDEPFTLDKVQVDDMTTYTEWLKNLVEKGYTLPGKKLGEFRPLAAQNRLAFAYDAPFFKGTVQSFDANITDEVFYDTWGVTTLPAGDDGNTYSAVGGSDHFTAAFATSEHKKEAVLFLEYLANSDFSLQEYVLPMGYLPVTNSVMERFPEINEKPDIKAFLEEIVPTAVTPPFGSDYTNAATVLATNLQEVISTDKSIDEILGRTQKEIEAVIVK